MQTTFKSILVIVLPLLSISGYAHTSVSSSCKQFSDDDGNHNICYQYVSGYIGGALTTDVAIINELEKDKPMSAYMERVFKTRATTQSKYYKATYFAKFCFKDAQVRDTLIKNIITHMDMNNLNDSNLDNRIYTTITSLYPCK